MIVAISNYDTGELIITNYKGDTDDLESWISNKLEIKEFQYFIPNNISVKLKINDYED